MRLAQYARALDQRHAMRLAALVGEISAEAMPCLEDAFGAQRQLARIRQLLAGHQSTASEGKTNAPA